jgi:hypothetical protein
MLARKKINLEKVTASLVRRMAGYRSLDRTKRFRLWLNSNQDRLLDFSPRGGETQYDCQPNLPD